MFDRYDESHPNQLRPQAQTLSPLLEPFESVQGSPNGSILLVIPKDDVNPLLIARLLFGHQDSINR